MADDRLEWEKDAAHELMHDLGACAVVLVTAHDDTESMFVSVCISAEVAEHQRVPLARALAGTLRRAALQMEDTVASIVAADAAAREGTKH